MIPFIAAGLVGSYLLKSLLSDSDSGSSVATINKLSPEEEFLAFFANILFRIDGVVHSEEEKILENYRSRTSDSFQKKLEDTLQSTETFSILRRQYKSLDKGAVEKMFSKFVDLSKVDGEVSECEEAILIQFAQMLKDYEKLPLFITCSAKPSNVLIMHDLFEYITEEEWRQRYKNSTSGFLADEIYTLHPFVSDALIPFSISGFEDSQNEFFEGIIPIMKELGASCVYISESKEQFSERQENVKADISVEYGEKGAGASGSSMADTKSILQNKEIVEVRFDGSKLPLLDRVLPGRIHKRLKEKYKHKPEYLTLIENRFGGNKINYFEYQIKSKVAKSLANGLDAAAKLDVSLVKGSASTAQSKSEKMVESIEKYFRAEFHS